MVRSKGRLEVTLPRVCWLVTLTTAKGNVEEEATWQTNVALALLRLSYPEKRYDFFPRPGDIEAMPFVKPLMEQQGVTLASDGMSAGGSSVPRAYVIDDDVVEVTESEEFRERADQIFSSKHTDRLANRFGQGLGWLTRGRQTSDQAERFLFFFTAIEALLSSDDKSAPVVQTICRHASVLLSNRPTERIRISKEMAKLYGQRSALVHAGKRNVSWTDANVVQSIAEELYTRVLNEYNLTSKLGDFQGSLSQASFGLRWPRKKI